MERPKSKVKTVYFAGKVSRNGGYRGELLGNGRCMSRGHAIYNVGGGRVRYGGCFAISCDHNCFHFDGGHGWRINSRDDIETGFFIDEQGEQREVVVVEHGLCAHFGYGTGVEVDGEIYQPRDLVSRCLDQIRKCDAVHAYIDSTDCYGTLVELGYASALGKPIHLVYNKELRNQERDELWFIKNMPSVKSLYYGEPDTINDDLLLFSDFDDKLRAVERRKIYAA